MITSHLNMNMTESSSNALIPVNVETDKVERELILKQLLYLRQDINEIKEYLSSNSSNKKITQTNPALFLPSDNTPTINNESDNIDDATIEAIKEDIVGEMTMTELEREVIEKYLKKFKGNRRKTAEALDISERTLYRKIKEYGL